MTNEWSCASGFATRLVLCQISLTMSGSWMRHVSCYQVTSTLRTTSIGVAHLLSIICKGHYTLWSALPGSPSPRKASLDHSGLRMTTSSLWQSTPSGISKCLINFGGHLVNKEGSSGTSSGSNRKVHWCYPPHSKQIIGVAAAAFRWPTGQSQLWPGLVAAFTGLEPPRFLSVGIYTLRTGCMATTPRQFLTWRQETQQKQVVSQKRNAGGPLRTSPIGSKCACSDEELISSTFFETSETKTFWTSTNLKL